MLNQYHCEEPAVVRSVAWVALSLLCFDVGEYPYRCGPHPEMQGKVRVEG